MKISFLFALTLLLYGVYGFYVSQVELTASKDAINLKTSGLFHDYRGSLNVHSIRSTGSGTPEDIIKEAQQAGLDFLVLTDVNDFPRPSQLEGYHGKLFVFVGGEYSFLDSRILYLSLNKNQQFQNLGEMQLHLTDLLSRSKPELKNELLVMAHPYQGRFTWSGAYPSGLDGIEVINLKQIYLRAWQESPASFLWSFVVLPFNIQYAFLRLFNPPNKELNLWEKLHSGGQKVYGFAGNDSTAKAIPIQRVNIRFPSHEQSFQTASNHILLRSELTGNASNDREKIFRALKNGQFYMSLDLLADPTGFVTYLTEGKKIYPLGSTASFAKNLKLEIELPRKPKYFFEVLVFRNGEKVYGSNETKLTYPISEPGQYRVSVRVIPTYPLPDGKKWLTWIYTNPIFVE